MIARLALAVVLALGFAPQETPLPSEHLRQRWSALPSEERARMERRLHQFEELPASSRRALLARARSLRERERALREGLVAQEEAPALEVEPGRQRRQAQLREHFRQHGRELRTRLPAELRRMLENGPSEKRARFLEHLTREPDRWSRHALRQLGQQLALDEPEERRLEELPLERRLGELCELGRRAERARRAPAVDPARPELR